MYEARIGDALHSLWRQNITRALTGSYVVSGLDASPGSSGQAIQVDVDSGDCRIDDQALDVASDTLTFDPVATNGEYRADVVYITLQGGLAVEKGFTDAPQPTISGDPYPAGDPQPARRLFAPSPPDGSSINGLPILVVMVADTVGDSTDLALEDLVDYRVPAPQPGAHTHPDLALNRRTELFATETAEYVKIATVNTGTGTGTGRLRLRLWSANARSQEVPRALDVDVITGASNVEVDAYAYGARQQATDVVVTEEPASQAGTAHNRYHAYLYLPQGAGTYAEMVHTDRQFGGYERIEGLAQNDLVGAVVHDTGGSTGGPGGETQVPKAPAAVRADVEGNSDVADLVSDEAMLDDQVAVSQADGTVAWKTRTRRTGQWQPLATYQFPHGGTGYSTSADVFQGATSGTEGVVIPSNTLNHGSFDALGVSLSAALVSDTNGSLVEARLAYNLLGGNNVTNTAISNGTTDITSKTSPVQVADLSGPVRLFLEMKTQGANTGTAYMPVVNVFGRVAP